MKSVLTNIALLAGSLGVFFFGIEFGLRITGLQTVKPNPPQIYQVSTDSRISYELKPNLNREPAYKAHVSTDEHGFRLNTPNPSPSPDPLLAVLGDSVAFGYGVEDHETLAAQLAPLLPDYRIINTAVPGYSLPMETAAYEAKVAPLRPAAVMLVFFWNDLDGFPPGKLDDTGVLREHNWDPSHLQCRPIETGILGMLPGRCWLDTHSAFYKAVAKLVNSRAGREKLAKEQEQAKQEDFADPATPDRLERYADELQEFTKALSPGTEKIFVIWPDRYLHPEGLPALKRMAAQRGFTVIDLYEKFGNEAETLPWDTVHPSPATLKAAAEFIVEKLGETG